MCHIFRVSKQSNLLYKIGEKFFDMNIQDYVVTYLRHNAPMQYSRLTKDLSITSSHIYLVWGNRESVLNRLAVIPLGGLSDPTVYCIAEKHIELKTGDIRTRIIAEPPDALTRTIVLHDCVIPISYLPILQCLVNTNRLKYEERTFTFTTKYLRKFEKLYKGNYIIMFR